MSRRYADPVEVRGDTGRPTAFLWKGRVYLVREVLARWVEAGVWWRSVADQPTARASLANPRRRAESVVAGVRSEPGAVDPPGGSVGRSGHVPVADDASFSDSLAVGDRDAAVAVGDREVWRVEAAAGRNAPVGVYDLARHGDVWRLARALD